MSGLDLGKYSEALAGAEGRADLQTQISSLLKKEITFFEKKLGPKEKEAFYSELGLLLSTGVDIKTSFDIISEDVKAKKYKILLEKIKTDIIGGRSLSEAIGLHDKIFSKYEIQSMRIGEETGKLPEVLKELASYYDSAIKLKRQIVGVLTYPIVVIGLALLIIYFMLSFVVPVFSDIFSQTGRQLPEITQFLIALSAKSSAIFYVIFLIIASVILLHKTQSRKAWYRAFTSTFFLKVPVVGKLIQRIYLARFCQSMKLLTSSKVMINEALDLVRNMIGYYPIEKALEEVRQEVVNQGNLLNESLAKHRIFPLKLVALIKLSEEVNAPEIIYDKLYKQYSAEIEHQQAVLGKLIEPVFIIFLGLFVGFILVAMYLPMFEMSSGSFT